MIDRAAIVAATAFFIAALSAGDSQAASFNCKLAQTPTENAICSNGQLSSLDDQTAGMYFEIIGSHPPPATLEQVKRSEVQFLDQRNACGANFDCIVSAYTSQIMYLKQTKEQLGL